MNITEVKSKAEQKKFLAFRREILGKNSHFVDNDIFMIKDLFAGKTSFTNNKEVKVYYVEEDGRILCEGMAVYTEQLKEYIQLSFFVSREGTDEAVTMLTDEVVKVGKAFGCTRLVIGLNGHVNYGLGLLASGYEKGNSFGSAINHEYFNTYFKNMGCEEITMSTYHIEKIDKQLERYAAFLRKVERNYTFKCFDKKHFEEYAKIYTDLNNLCFNHHRYYYPRSYQEDIEMLKELFLFMKEDSLIFAFDGDKPVAFIMWYPDFNELAKPGEAFGAKHFIKNLFLNKKLNTAKVMEYGVLEEYRTVGMPLVLIHQVFLKIVANYGATRAETSWVLDENTDSSGFCKAVCDGVYKRYIVYEKEI